jgi:teichuronic acid biosynthesis glycosyltransferase TuaC
MTSALSELRQAASAVEPLRVITLTNQWPRPTLPYCGVMVVRQVESLRRCGVEVEVISISGGIRSYLGAARAMLALNRGPRRADLVHAHTGHSGLLACLQLRYPVVLSYVGYDLDTPAEDKEGPRTQFERVVFRLLSLVLAGTIAKSERGARHLPSLGRRRNAVIPNGVDRVLFAPAHRAEARAHLGWGDEPTVLFAADPTRFTKRFELARAAVDAAQERVRGLRLVVAHEISPADMPIWMNAADVLLLTSRGEGSPNVIKEAMACDLPIVSVDVGDVREIVEGARHCHVCADDPSTLADAMVEVIAALPERSDGRDQSEALDEVAVADRIVELYGRVRNRGPGALGFLPRRRR